MSGLRDIPTPTLDFDTERARPRVLAILFCDLVNFSHDSKANLIGVFDSIRVILADGATPQFTLFLRLANVGVGPVGIDIFTPSNERIGHAVFAPDSENEDEMPQVQVSAPLFFVAREPGPYWISVSHRDRVIGGTALNIEREVIAPKKEDRDEADGLALAREPKPRRSRRRSQ